MTMRTYYCADIEYRKDGTFSGAVNARDCERKPESTLRFLRHATDCTSWFADTESAEAFLASLEAPA